MSWLVLFCRLSKVKKNYIIEVPMDNRKNIIIIEFMD